jgi:hypothetical protein
MEAVKVFKRFGGKRVSRIICGVPLPGRDVVGRRDRPDAGREIRFTSSGLEV